MGISYLAKCLTYGNNFTIYNGSSFLCHILYCDRCGKPKVVHFNEISDLHSRYVKGLDRPYSSLTATYDSYIQETLEVEPISKEQYHALVEKSVGRCSCGGTYSFNANPRCPKCHSADIEIGKVLSYYD
jgi:hypothetical protein